MNPLTPINATADDVGPGLLPVPAHLQGVRGAQRAALSVNVLGADNDHEAIVVWLNTRAKNGHTRKAYLQELRRFMAFMLYIRGRPLSSASVGDLEAFRVWLAVPYLPSEGWPAGYMPFKLETASANGQATRLRGLAIGSRRRADTTIRSFFRFLHEGGYLAANPCMKLGRLTGEEISLDELEKRQLSPEAYARQRRREAIALDNQDGGKAFPVGLWRWLRGFLDSDENTWQIPDSPVAEPPGPGPVKRWPQERRERLRCILLFSYAAASRRAELAETTMNAIVRSGQRWVWKVIGKGRTASDGRIFHYVHTNFKVGALLELNSETDFVAKTDEFNELGHEIAMHITAANPLYLRPEDVPAEDLEREKEIYRQQLRDEGKPEDRIEKIVEGKVRKFYESTCLMEQAYIRDPDKKIGDLVVEMIAKLGENIVVRRFARFMIGE